MNDVVTHALEEVDGMDELKEEFLQALQVISTLFASVQEGRELADGTHDKTVARDCATLVVFFYQTEGVDDFHGKDVCITHASLESIEVVVLSDGEKDT